MLEDHIVDEVGRKLRKLGFRKKRLTWRREGENGIEVFNIQRSQYGGGTVYLNVGVYYGPDEDPQEYQCNVRERVNHEGRTGEDVFAEVVAWFERQAAPAPPLPVEPTPPVRVRHAKFGDGLVVADQGPSVRVAFDDGTTRLLRREFVEMI